VGSPASQVLWRVPNRRCPSRSASLSFGSAVPVVHAIIRSDGGCVLPPSARGLGVRAHLVPQFVGWRHLRFPGCLPVLVRSPCSPDPGGIGPPRHCGGPIAACQTFNAVGFPTTSTFGAQSHGSRTRCLRFAARVAPAPRKTRYRPAGYAFAGWVSHPLDGSSKFQDVIGSSILLDRPLPGAMNGYHSTPSTKRRLSLPVVPGSCFRPLM
jgi:hypothetical protein